MTALTLCDTTLRDGSHPKRHRWEPDDVTAITSALATAGVDVVEVGHGDGLGGSSRTYGIAAATDGALVRAAVDAVAGRARVAVLLLPGIGTRDDLRAARDAGADVARVATHCTEADIAQQHLGLAADLGMTPVGFLMMAHRIEPDRLAEGAEIMAQAGARVVYVTDSAGALLPDGARRRVAALRDRLPDDVAIGFHGHQNLSLAVANTLAAAEEGATWVDGCMCGLGAGAGNAPTEALAAALQRGLGFTGCDPLVLFDVAEDVVRPRLPREMVVDRDALVLGYVGVYSSFLLHARDAGARFDVDSATLLLEAGRRGAVGGQEDLLWELAAELAPVGA